MDWEVFYSSFRKPDFIPGYEIQNRLGGGAFGEVFKARKHSIGKPYAIKFLKIDDEGQREAVERELEQVRHFAAIDHPNLVTIEDLGTVLGVPYLIMGYAGEETLARRLRQGALGPEDALSYFVQISRGVLALHDRRLVHFDLKPGNVFLKGDIARVGDYGLSKLMTSGRLTLSFGRGTPHYMAPEILRSRADHRADIYSLGVMLYECYALRVPFEGDTPAGLVLRQEDLPPHFPQGFPADVRPVVERCLRLDPLQRYASVEELLEDLRATARAGDSTRLDRASAPSAPNATANRPERSEAESMAPAEARRGAAGELARGASNGSFGGASGRRQASPVAPPPLRRRAATPPPIPIELIRASAPVSTSARTIPVPPRARGGALGALGTALALGFEVLATLLRGIARWVARGFVLSRGSSQGPARSLPRRLLRLALSLAFLAFAGGAIMLLVILLLNGASMR